MSIPHSQLTTPFGVTIDIINQFGVRKWMFFDTTNMFTSR
ncbi:hypothetical protein GNY17_09295 [Vibrio parahaemolyticus]|nr:hypothetical protein GNY17_09295 [Vibrio parahaemolyticus]HAT7738813.1 hypothetical protein [Vibrio vulnificus]